MPREPSTSWAMKPAKPIARRVITGLPVLHYSHRSRGISANSGLGASRLSTTRLPRSGPGAHHDRRLHLADPLDCCRHDVAGLQPATERLILDLEQAARPDSPGTEDLARPHVHVGRRPGEHLPEGVARTRPGAASDLDTGAVCTQDRRGHLEGRRSRAGRPTRSQLIRGHDPGPDAGREVLALGRPEPDGRFVTLQVAGGPVVQDEVAADRLARSPVADGARGWA